MQHLTKSLPASIKASNNTFSAVITTDAVDNVGEVLLPDGMIAAEFMRRGTIFWNHDYNRPVGKIVGELKRLANGWESSWEFAEKPADYTGEWFPDAVRALVSQGVVKGVSVGLDPIEMRPPTPKDRAIYGPQCSRVISKWKLLEWSIAPLQCNPDALVTAVRKGFVTLDAVRPDFPSVDFDKEPVQAEPEPAPAKKRRVVIAFLSQDRTLVDVKKEVRDAVARLTGALYSSV